MSHARLMDRRWTRALQCQQTKNQELQKNMVALASQMKGLKEETMIKLRLQQPYPPSLSASVPPASTAAAPVRTQSESTETSISPGASPQTPVKSGASSTDSKVVKDVHEVSVGAVKPDNDVTYGELSNFICFIIKAHCCVVLDCTVFLNLV